MSETPHQDLSGVAETLLIALYVRAVESQRPDGLIKDEKAVALVTRMGDEFDRIKRFLTSGYIVATTIRRNQELDRQARDFLARQPEAVVVHIGCGLDSRFERVDNGQVEWYDLDFPDVIELRRKFLGAEGGRYHLLGCSVLDSAWLDTVSAQRQCPCLFLAEGVSMHLEEAQVKWLVLTLRDRFPGAELVFDAYSPIHLWVSNLLTARAGFRCHWGLWHGQEIEGWADGIRLLGEWGYLDRSEPRLARFQWLRYIPLVPRAERIYHFQLGKAAG